MVCLDDLFLIRFLIYLFLYIMKTFEIREYQYPPADPPLLEEWSKMEKSSEW